LVVVSCPLCANAYGLVQLYIVSLRKALRASTLLYLFFVGALSSVALTVVLQSLVLFYWGRTAASTALLATIEELAKAAPSHSYCFAPA